MCMKIADGESMFVPLQNGVMFINYLNKYFEILFKYYLF